MQYRVTNLQSTPLIVVGYHFQGAEVRIIEEAALDTALWWYSVGSGRLLEIEPIDAEVESEVESEVEPEDTSGLKDEKSETAGKEGSTDDDDDDDEGSDDKGSEKSTTSTDGGENE